MFDNLNNFKDKLSNSLWNFKNKFQDWNPDKVKLYKFLQNNLLDDETNSYFNNEQNYLNPYSDSVPQFTTPKDLSVNFSTFKTSDYIKNSTNNIQNILKQNQVSYQDLGNINNFVENSIKNMFNDYDGLANSYSTLPQNPTIESSKRQAEIEKHRLQSRENASNAIIMLNQAKNALNKYWGGIDTNDVTHLNDYLKRSEHLNNLSNGVMELFDTMSKVNRDRQIKANEIRQRLGFGLPTGYAANIANTDIEFDKPLNFVINGFDIKFPNTGNYKYYVELNKMLENEVGNFLKEHTNSPTTYSNDIRHQYVSALYARNLGEKESKWLGNLNEWTEYFRGSSSGTEDSKIDKINNEIGIKYGLMYPKIKREKLLEILFNDWKKNRDYAEKILKNKI